MGGYRLKGCLKTPHVAKNDHHLDPELLSRRSYTISFYSPVSGVNYARSIVLDPRTGHMYWCQYSDSNLDGGIFSASMDGTNVVEINKSVSTPFGCDIRGL